MGKSFYEIEKFELINDIPHYNDKILVISKNSQGYSRVIINKKAVRLHRIIAEKYVPNSENHPIVDHKDDNKENNKVNNLQWISYSENSKKAYSSNDKMKTMHNSECRRIIISEKDGVIKEHTSLRKCGSYLNRDVAAVYRALNGEWKLCAGHKLTYKLIKIVD